MDTKDWEMLTVLHQTKNLTQAARYMHTTQPALSIRLRNIESFFGAQIAVRGRGGVSFTREGEFLAREAHDHLKKTREIRDNLANMQESFSGVLRVGATNFMTKYVLMRIMRTFKQLHPGVEFRITTDYSKNVLRLAEHEDVHVAFIRGRYPWRGERRLLFKEPVILLNKHPVPMEDLPKLPMILWKVDRPNLALLDRWWQERFQTPPLVTMEVDRPDTCYDLVNSGFGYSFLPMGILPADTPLYYRELFFAHGEPVERSAWMIYHAKTARLCIARAFVDLVQSMYSPGANTGGQTAANCSEPGGH